jgi:uncharacterized protein YndB with AHSA1/START domain
MTTTQGSAVVSLPSDTRIEVTREFDAPPAVVFRAYTEAEYVRRWWAGQRGTVTSVEIDFRVGGRWRYVMTAHGGFEVAFNGEFSEIVPGERIVNTESYEGAPPGVPAAVITTTFTDLGGRTRFTQITDVDSLQTRDMIIDSGMEGGMQEGLDIVEEIAVDLASATA